MNRASAQTTCGAFASPPPAATTIGELLFDDTIPNNLPQWWTTELLTNGLGVKSADFDGNGYPDIVITGNDKDLDPTVTYPAPASTISAKVIYLGFNAGTNSIQVLDVEVLDPDFTRGAYGVAVGNLNGDTRPDLLSVGA